MGGGADSVTEDKQTKHNFTFIRLALLLLQGGIILSNRGDQSANILSSMGHIEGRESAEFALTEQAFFAANTMGLVFVIMQLLILYVGTNSHRVGPTLFSIGIHLLGCYCYLHHTQWQYQNMWLIFHLCSFLPLVTELGVALFTAKS